MISRFNHYGGETQSYKKDAYLPPVHFRASFCLKRKQQKRKEKSKQNYWWTKCGMYIS